MQFILIRRRLQRWKKEDDRCWMLDVGEKLCFALVERVEDELEGIMK